MSRRIKSKVVVPTTFVGTFYDVETGVYVATRKDGTMTVGPIGKRGLNVASGLVAATISHTTKVEH